MQRYVLTERGKLLVAMFIVLLLILPSVIIVILMSNKDSASGGSKNNSINDSVPLNTPDLTQFLPYLTGPIALDVDEGIMTFLFTPNSQTELDDESFSMLGELLKSPQNTNSSTLAVEIPLLSDEETAVVTAAVIDAFNKYSVPLSKIIFYVYHPESNIQTYEITMRFS